MNLPVSNNSASFIEEQRLVSDSAIMSRLHERVDSVFSVFSVFRWYLENVYPESTMRKEFTQLGEIRSHSSSLCLDINVGGIESPLIMSGCHGRGGHQFFALTTDQLIVTIPNFCVGTNKQQYAVVSVKCNDQSQKWAFNYEKKWLQHITSGLCMMANELEVVLAKCDSENDNLVWDINLEL